MLNVLHAVGDPVGAVGPRGRVHGPLGQGDPEPEPGPDTRQGQQLAVQRALPHG